MILYHGSNTVVNKPEIRQSNRYLDFGSGFYTTTNLDQASSFARKVVKREKCGKCIVNVYEFSDIELNKLNVLGFESANEEWLDFVSNNRNGLSNKGKYDLIYGPVADDEIYRTFLLYLNGLLTKVQTLEMLKIKKLYNQYVFTSSKAIDYLKFVEAKEINHHEQ